MIDLVDGPLSLMSVIRNYRPSGTLGEGPGPVRFKLLDLRYGHPCGRSKIRKVQNHPKFEKGERWDPDVCDIF